MNLIVVRHGRAGSPVTVAKGPKADELRPLTVDGRNRMLQNAEGLAKIVSKLDSIGTSPLVRAVETAQILAKAFDKAPVKEVPDLKPGGDRAKVLGWIAKHPLGNTVAITGHEDSLSRLVAWLVTGRDKPFCELKKGGACCVSMKTRIAAGAGQLEWLLTPRQLRRFRR